MVSTVEEESMADPDYPSEKGGPISGDPPDQIRFVPAEPVLHARALAQQTRRGDPHRTAGDEEPGSGGAPGGEPLAVPGEPAPAGPVPPPGTAEGGTPAGPPAHHRQVPR
jgi:hypothetical protein